MLNTVKKTKLELGARKQWCYVAILHRAVRIDLSDKELYQQQHKRSEGVSLWVSGEKIFQAYRTVSIKHLRLKHGWHETWLALSRNNKGARMSKWESLEVRAREVAGEPDSLLSFRSWEGLWTLFGVRRGIRGFRLKVSLAAIWMIDCRWAR